jgi:hypothetical protein
MMFAEEARRTAPDVLVGAELEILQGMTGPDNNNM